MHRPFKVFFASALGAGVGAAIALSLHPFLWWIGLIAGGLTGYLSFEYKTMLSALRRASIRSYIKHLAQFRPVEGWYWRTVSGVMWTFTALSWVGAVYLLGNHVQSGMLLEPGQELYVPILAISSSAIIYSCGMIWLGWTIIDPKPVDASDVGDRILNAFIASSPVIVLGTIAFCMAVCVVSIYMTILDFIKTAKNVLQLVPGMAYWIRDTTVFLFLEIHSDVRLICGVDAAAGASIGYFTGSVIIGAVCGGLIGVINYEIVTKRWLIPHGYIRRPNLTREA